MGFNVMASWPPGMFFGEPTAQRKATLNRPGIRGGLFLRGERPTIRRAPSVASSPHAPKRVDPSAARHGHFHSAGTLRWVAAPQLSARAAERGAVAEGELAPCCS